jgi:stage V sporulation protein SpoVS
MTLVQALEADMFSSAVWTLVIILVSTDSQPHRIDTSLKFSTKEQCEAALSTIGSSGLRKYCVETIQ